MQLQPVVMNLFPPDSASDPRSVQSPDNPFGDAGGSLVGQMFDRAEEICKSQDKRIASDQNAYARSRSSTARLLILLDLQRDLDHMQETAAMAKNIAEKFDQALNTLTQRN
ncbi:hypothetical protein GCT13_07205 [Paraburkholderia sp. CNPSo 3157]|uniref:Uncharacterized protein n=1 Tax=Paraburkholderia franconis TaxID=2654983 RepID=A0A7X1N7D5_9BURK|nr:hypothetical protein [Paraburkholderia franconis]MPW16728.1 hypothetical protein [Paraburkholderia franconis]